MSREDNPDANVERSSDDIWRARISRRATIRTIAKAALCSFVGVPASFSGALAVEQEESLAAAAKREGRGMLYTVTPPEPTAALLNAFTAKYGIPIDIQKLTGAALAQRFVAERESGLNIVDLFVSSDPLFPSDAMRKGWLKRSDDLPAVAALPKGAVQDGLAPVAIYPYVLAWNSSRIPAGLKSWEELNDPRWRGQVLVGDPRVLANARLWYVALLRRYGETFLKRLGEHATFSPSVVPGLQQLAAGSMAIYAPAVHSSVVDIIERGAPVDYTVTSPVVIGQPMAGVSASAPHPNVARLLLNFWISREGQAIYSRGGYTLLPDVPGTKQIATFDPVDSDAGERELPRINALLGIG